MKTALITGSQKGIGFETARQLGKRGFHVILSGRNKEKLEKSLKTLMEEGIDASMLVMDVSDDYSVTVAAEALARQISKLDVLINNAAILLREDEKVLQQGNEVLLQTVNTNSYGPLRVSRALVPLMRDSSRIINITSEGGSMSLPVGGWSPAYCVSKTMLNAITRNMALELSGKGIAVNAACPGWVRTDMGGASAPRTVEKGAETPVWLASEASQTLTGRIFMDKKEISW